MYWIESLHGVTLDAGNTISELVIRHMRASKQKANIYLISGGYKKLIQQVN